MPRTDHHTSRSSSTLSRWVRNWDGAPVTHVIMCQSSFVGAILAPVSLVVVRVKLPYAFFFAPCEKVWDRFQSRFRRRYRTDRMDPNHTDPFVRNPVASEEGGRLHWSVDYPLRLNGMTATRSDAATRRHAYLLIRFWFPRTKPSHAKLAIYLCLDLCGRCDRSVFARSR